MEIENNFDCINEAFFEKKISKIKNCDTKFKRKVTNIEYECYSKKFIILFYDNVLNN